jgi:uncharacterized membrane protein
MATTPSAIFGYVVLALFLVLLLAVVAAAYLLAQRKKQEKREEREEMRQPGSKLYNWVNTADGQRGSQYLTEDQAWAYQVLGGNTTGVVISPAFVT